ncbi:TPA: autotransporter domain-containing protein [Neisseria subflava]
MRIKKTSSIMTKNNNHQLSTALTTLTCMLAGMFPIYTQAASIYGCSESFFSNENANGCSASVGLRQKLDGDVIGGSAYKGSANKNRVNIAHKAHVSGAVIGGSSTRKEANHNEVVIGNNVQIGTEKDNGFVEGGSSNESSAIFNAVRIGANAIINGFVEGGSASPVKTDEAGLKNIEIDSSSNSVHIGDNSVVTGSVSGGSDGMLSSFNEVYIGNNVRVGPKLPDDQLILGGIVTGGSAGHQTDYVPVVTNSNIVHIGDDFYAAQVLGGSSGKESSVIPDNTENENRVTIGDRSRIFNVVAGNGTEKAIVNKNELRIGKDANINRIRGGYAWNGSNVSENLVTIGANLTADEVMGGQAGLESEANNNTVMLGRNATVRDKLVGGVAVTRANGNKVLLNRDFKIANLLGGGATEEANNNIVTLLGRGEVSGKLYGGVSNNKSVGNTLNLGNINEPIEMNSISAGKVGYFNTYNFYLPNNTRNQDIALKLLGIEGDFDSVIDLGNATVNSYVPGDAALKAGDIVHLIQIGPNDEIKWTGQGKVYQGVTLTHDLADIRVDDQSKNLDLVFQKNNIKDSINVPANNNGSVNNTGTGDKNNASNNTDTTMLSANVNPKTKSLLQGRLVAPALINGGSAYLLEGGLESFYQNTNVDKNKANTGSNGFANVRADNREVTTGSHVKLKGMTFDAGYAWNKPLGLGNLTYGIAAEYGYTRYTSHLDDGTRGKGKAWYLGANTFGNYLWNNGLYIQGSLRIGRVSGDYRSNDFVHANGNQVNYDSKSNYIAGHIGAGKLWQLGSLNSLDTYIKYFDSHTSSDKAKLNSGETYHFSSVRSQRGRIGVQYNHQLAKTKLHFGLAHEREWNGHVRAQYQGLSLPSPTMKGGTTLGEAGVNYQLGGKQLNTALQVYGGRQRGAGLHLGVKF